jgi:hypothetical protein
MNSAMEQMMAERQRQDSGLFKTEEVGVATVVSVKADEKPLIKLYKQTEKVSATECYSLSS